MALNQLPGLNLTSCIDASVGEVAQRAVGLDRAELVARPFFDDVGNDEVVPVGRQFRERRNDAEIGVALSQVERAQLLLIGRQPVRIIGVVRFQEAKDAARPAE